jgi:hypothetical protein
VPSITAPALDVERLIRSAAKECAGPPLHDQEGSNGAPDLPPQSFVVGLEDDPAGPGDNLLLQEVEHAPYVQVAPSRVG